MRAYLEDVGGASWLDRRLEEADGAPNAGELLVEFGGRACYRSWEPGLNPNVTRVRNDRREYLENILRSAHGSVLEHASYSFALRNVSRVFTHELVRHRAGSAFSQESLRYVRLTDIGFRVPPALEPVRERALAIVEALEEFQRDAADDARARRGRAFRSTSRRRRRRRCGGSRRSASRPTSSGAPTCARCAT